MKSKVRLIVIVFSVITICFLLFSGFGIYYIYKVGEQKGVLEDDSVMSLSSEYRQKKDLLDEQEHSLILEEEMLEKQYVNQEIIYNEYKIRKRQLKIQRETLKNSILDLEKEYGVDDLDEK